MNKVIITVRSSRKQATINVGLPTDSDFVEPSVMTLLGVAIAKANACCKAGGLAYWGKVSLIRITIVDVEGIQSDPERYHTVCGHIVHLCDNVLELLDPKSTGRLKTNMFHWPSIGASFTVDLES